MQSKDCPPIPCVALPAGLGDIATGLATPLVAREVAHGGGRRAALWLNAFGFIDLIVALTLGALTRVPRNSPPECTADLCLNVI